MTTANVANILFRAGVKSVQIEATPHENIVRLRIGPDEDFERARRIIETSRGLSLLHAWIDSGQGALYMRVEMTKGRFACTS